MHGYSQYFAGTDTLEGAKRRYRQLAMQMHPDRGGNKSDFVAMQQEYRALLLHLEEKAEPQGIKTATVEQRELMHELATLGKTILQSGVPQRLLRKKAMNAQSTHEKNLYTGIISILDKLK